MRLLRRGFPDRPAFGTAVSEAILHRVAAGELGATLRVHRPARELAFAKQDRAAPGFGAAVRAARAAGFEPVIRLAGGRAAVFTEGTLALAWSRPDPRPTRRTHERFEELAEIVAEALRGLGVDARIGEVPGEYCPGAWSVNARGAVKLAGLGQRIVRGGAHLGAVIVVSGDDLIRQALEPVYAALGLDWDPRTAGSVAAEVGEASIDVVEAALLDQFARHYELVEAELNPPILERAAELEAEHRAPH
ncbi:MAG: biotin/lipoate A/B protein ligase family protein [Solirubrobacterales bacterium]